MKSIISSSVLSGIAIGTAGFGYLASGKDIVGAVLFAFGLATVVHYSLKLYTGTAGFIRRGELGTLFLILFFNLVGCALMGLMARCSPLPLQETAQGILEGRLAMGGLGGGVVRLGVAWSEARAGAVAGGPAVVSEPSVWQLPGREPVRLRLPLTPFLLTSSFVRAMRYSPTWSIPPSSS